MRKRPSAVRLADPRVNITTTLTQLYAQTTSSSASEHLVRRTDLISVVHHLSNVYRRISAFLRIVRHIGGF